MARDREYETITEIINYVHSAYRDITDDMIMKMEQYINIMSTCADKPEELAKAEARLDVIRDIMDEINRIVKRNYSTSGGYAE